MTVFVALILTALTFALVAYPFFKQRSRLTASVEDDTQRELYSKRDTTYSMLKELEFDFQSGILTEEDYRDLETRYKRKAISTLKDIDSLAQGVEAEDEIEKQVLGLRRSQVTPRSRATGRARKDTSVEDAIEKQVQKLRRVKSSQGDEEVEQEILELRRDKSQFCTQCGAKCQEGDRFCSRCGTNLNRGEIVD